MDIISTRTKDGITLKAAFYNGTNSNTCLIFPGFAGNFVDNDFLRNISDFLNQKGYNVIFANTRGSFNISSSNHPLNLEKPKRIGAVFEKFEDCIYDIDAWIDYIKANNLGNIHLIGHSSANNKIIHYMNSILDNKKEIHDIIMLAPPDFADRIKHYKNYKDVIQEAKDNIIAGKENKIVNCGFLYKTSISFLDMIASKNFDNFPLVNGNYNDFVKFRNIEKPLTIIVGSLDEYIYNYIDKIKEYSNPNYKCDIKVIQDGDHIFFGKDNELAQVVFESIDLIDNKILTKRRDINE